MIKHVHDLVLVPACAPAAAAADGSTGYTGGGGWWRVPAGAGLSCPSGAEDSKKQTSIRSPFRGFRRKVDMLHFTSACTLQLLH